MSIQTNGPRLIALAAMAENRVIGIDGKLPWHLPADLKFFKRTTTGKAILFGRTTYEGIGKPLPNRKNYVLSRNWKGEEGVEVLRRVEDVRSLTDDLIYVCGGAVVYETFFPICDELLLTRVTGHFDGDTYLPAFESYFEHHDMIEAGEGYRIDRLLRKDRN